MRSFKLELNSSALILILGVLCQPNLSAQTTPAAAPVPTPTVRIYTREVALDIDVADAKGNPVHGLTRDNFTVLEDGKPMIARTFREHLADQQDGATPVATSLPPNTFTNAGPPESVQPLNMLLLDSLDTPIATQSMVQKQMVDFVEKIGPGTRIAVFSLSATGQLSMLQGFTSDRELLKKALKSKALTMQVSPLEDAGQDESNDTASLDMNQQTGTKNSKPAPQLQCSRRSTLPSSAITPRLEFSTPPTPSH